MTVLQSFRNNLLIRSLNYAYRSLVPLPLSAVEIETTTVCNRKCEYCPNYTVGRPAAYMQEQTFYKIIDSLKKQNFSGRISPHFYGEPLMDKRLETLIAYVRANLPAAFIKLFTNGELLTTQRYLALKQAGVDMFRVSQHTERPSDTVTRTLSEIKEHHPKLYSVEYVDYFNDRALKLNRGGLVKAEPRKMYSCSWVDQLTFDYRGNAVLCCNDYNSSLVFGNIHEKDIQEIWHDRKYRKMRNLVANGFWPYEICRICSGQNT